MKNRFHHFCHKRQGLITLLGLIFFALCGTYNVSGQNREVDFTATKWEGCAPLTVKFTPTLSDNNYSSINWSFGIGADATIPEPSRSFTSPGAYTVILTVTYADGAVLKKEKQVNAYKKPTVDFTTSVTEGCTPLKVDFTDKSTPGDGSITNVVWDFGDGVNSTGSTATHTYTQGAEQTVTIIVTNSHGCTSSNDRQIKVQEPPEVKFTSDVQEACQLPLTVTFTNTSTVVPDVPLTLLWDFGDGTTGTNPQHTYTQEGDYTVSLKAVTPGGCEKTLSIPDYIKIHPMRASFNVNGGACASQKVQLVNTSQPAPSAARWEFPDGSVQNSVNASYTFPQPGNYDVKMTAIKGDCEETITQTIQVHPLPSVDFTANTTVDCHLPSMISFTAQAPGATSWQWDFGDGGTSTEQNPEHSYQKAGVYTVTLVAANAGGCTKKTTKTDYILVQEPMLSFNASEEGGCIPFSPVFTPVVSSPDAVVSYTWDFGDGTPPSSQERPSHTFNKEGDFVVTLEVETQSGCKLTHSMTIEVGKNVNVDFSVDKTEACQPTRFTFTNLSNPKGDKYLWEFPDDNHKQTEEENPWHIFTYAGMHDVTLTVYNNGCASTLTKPALIEIYTPAAHFIVDKVDCDKPFDRQFTDKSSLGSGPATFEWSFGDGNTSGEKSPKHTYATSGTYKASLKVTAGACYSIVNKIIYVIDKKPVIKAASPDICDGSNLSCTVEPLQYDLMTSYKWSWDDGTFTTISKKDFRPDVPYRHRYKQPGTYKVSLTVKDVNGCTHVSDSLTINVRKVTADVVVSKPFCKGSPVSFSDQSASAPAGEITSWSWDFGDGTPPETYTTPKNPVTHTFSEMKDYKVKLTVTNKYGCKDDTVRTISIDKLKAVISVGGREACLNVPFGFSNRSTGTGLTYQWDFGDGGTSPEKTPSHTYTNPGVYTVKLTVTNANGCQDTQEIPGLITVRNAVADFTVPDNLGECPPILVQFTNQSSDFDQAVWTFGDGSSSTQKSPVHIYRRAGDYEVQLKVSTNAGCSNIVRKPLQLKGPDGRQSVTPLTGCAPLPIKMSATSINTTKYIWDFDDGEVVSTDTAGIGHQYTKPGIFYPRLILEDANGCQVTALGATTRVVVDQVTPHFSVDASQACDGGIVYFHDSTKSITKDELGLPLTYQWDFGVEGRTDDISSARNPEFNYPQTGTYPVKLAVTSSYGCKGEATLPAVIAPRPIAEILPITPVCVGAPATLQGRDTRQLPGTEWLWKVEPNMQYTVKDPPGVTFSEAGDKRVLLIISSPDGACPDTAESSARVNPLPALKPTPELANVCKGEAIQLQANVAAGTKVTWTNYNISDMHSPSPKASPETDTTYHVRAESTMGCISEADVRLTVTQPHQVSVSDTAICKGKSVQLHASGATRYQWIGGSLDRTDVADPTASPENTTAYTVVGFGKDDCFRDTARAVVTVNPLPLVNAGPDREVPVGSELRLQLQQSPDVTKVQWQPDTWLSCADCPDPMAIPKSSIKYHITATNQFNCVSTDELNIKLVCESGVVFLPNTFSPNGDGQNDIFYVRGKGIQTVKVFKIFNRWGQLVFERTNFNTEDPAAGWDGRYQGTYLNADVFIYFAELVCDTGEPFTLKGNVTLLR